MAQLIEVEKCPGSGRQRSARTNENAAVSAVANRI